MFTPNWVMEKLSQIKESGPIDLDLSKPSGTQPLTEIPSEIFAFSNLQKLNLSDNELSYIPDKIAELQDLRELNLNGNRFVSFPSAIISLSKLTRLYLSYNGLLNIPETISRLQDLRELYLYENLLGSLPTAIGKLRNLSILHVESNQLTTPPQEIAERGVHAIQEYFRQLDEVGHDQLYEAKLLILGEGGAGKTTLSKKIENSNYVLQDEVTTEGIDVSIWSFPTSDNKSFRVNIWDFGGQEIYHATHQFFLTRRSLYVLVADTRKEDTDFYYWLNVVSLLSNNSPLLIVKNEKQDRHREINERQLRGQFENLKEILSTNLATNRGLFEVKDAIEHYIKKLPHIGSALPKTWVRVREKLENDKRNYIPLQEYLDLCEENDFGHIKDALQLSGYLHDIGVFLHFQDDPLLSKTVILKPKWGTDAVYKVLDDKYVIKNLGVFTRFDVEGILGDPMYVTMVEELLQLMMKFRLCYEIPDQKGTYIAPQLLTENQPDYEWSNKDNLLLRYVYEFMPKGILTQFIVAMHRHIAVSKGNFLAWKSGVVIAKSRTGAEVIEHYGKRQVYVRITGAHKKELMSVVMHELDKIHATYKRLKYDKLIPCNCSECKNKKEPYFFRFDTLQKFIEDRQDQIQCQQSYKMVNARSLIDDVIGWKSEKEMEEIMAKQKRQQFRPASISVGSINVGGKAKVEGFNLGGTIKESFNKADTANIENELKETLKLLAQAVDKMSKEMSEERATEVADDFERLVDETTKPNPIKKWYSVSIDGLMKAAEKIGKVGEPVIELSKKVLSLLTMDAVK